MAHSHNHDCDQKCKTGLEPEVHDVCRNGHYAKRSMMTMTVATMTVTLTMKSESHQDAADDLEKILAASRNKK